MRSRTNILVQLVCVLAVMTAVHSKLKAKPIDNYFKLCPRRDQKELNECVKKSVMQAKSVLKDGIPALGLVPLEPLVIPKMELVQGTGTFALKTSLINYTIRGLSTYTVTDANFVLDDKTLDFNLTLYTPEMIQTADYKMEGQILVLPIRGEGNCEMNYTDVVAVSRTKGRVVERNGARYIQLLSIDWDLSVNAKTSRTWFFNLFNGDQLLGNATNNFLNANGEEAFKAVKHLPEEAFGQVFKDIASKVYDAYPIKELFLD